MADSTLKLRDSGPEVALAQDLLNRSGAILVEDGDFGQGTATAVREFRALQGLPDSSDIDAQVWTLLRGLPLPSQDIPTKAVAFIAREEVSSRSYYDQYCSSPTWPGGASGVTIGVGYDLGYQDGFTADWSDLLPATQLERLKSWMGVKGSAASAAPAQLADIKVPWHAAWEAYVRRTLPQEITTTRGAFTPAMIRPLPPLCLGVLVSLVYNRGPAMNDNSADDRRREMRDIRDAVASGNYESVPDALRSMCRLWPEGSGLNARRKREASLFEEGLQLS